MNYILTVVLFFTLILVQAHPLVKDSSDFQVALPSSEDLIKSNLKQLKVSEFGEQIQKGIKDQLDELLEKVKEAIDNGKAVKEDQVEKLKELRQKLKDMHKDIGTHAKDLTETIKEKSKAYWKKILEKLGLNK